MTLLVLDCKGSAAISLKTKARAEQMLQRERESGLDAMCSETTEKQVYTVKHIPFTSLFTLPVARTASRSRMTLAIVILPK